MDDEVGNKPAFPLAQNAPWGGMTLRDWFAGMAAQGLAQGFIHSEAAAEDIALHAYNIADHLLAERLEQTSDEP